MSYLETALPWSQVIERRHGYLHIWESLVHVRPYINTLAGIHLSLGILEKIFCELGIDELFIKVSWAVCSEHLPMYKKEYNGTKIHKAGMLVYNKVFNCWSRLCQFSKRVIIRFV